MIQARGLTKRYGPVLAVDGLTFDVLPGRVTGFLGPNGAGKSTTMRLILGLDRPTAGTVTVGGRPYRGLRWPLREVGAMLESGAVHPGRSARGHLLALARPNAIPARRVEEVLSLAGLDGVAGQRAGGFSLGMTQRLGIAAALLGDPRVLLLDEPVNGLDAEGVAWIRGLLRSLAGQGRAVFVSSHLMSEMELTADRLVVIGRGRLLVDAPIGEVLAGSSQRRVKVRGPDPAGLRTLAARLAERGLPAEVISPRELLVAGTPVEPVGELAHRLGVPLHELSSQGVTLEQAYMELTAESLEYAAPRKEER
jgi:ABC-2 type transport system ATP-binding protein